MPFSSGTFSELYNWVNEANAGNPIDATKMNNQDVDIASGLSTCLLKDGTQTVTANIPMGGFKFTGLGAPSSNNDSMTLGYANANYAIISKAVKSTTTSRNTTIVLADDPDLVLSGLAAGSYAIKLFLLFTGTTTGAQGFQGQLVFTGTSSVATYGGQGSRSGAAQNLQTSFSFGSGFTAGGSISTTQPPDFLSIDATLICSTTGNLKFQWCQASSNANNTNLQAGSFLIATKLA